MEIDGLQQRRKRMFGQRNIVTNRGSSGFVLLSCRIPALKVDSHIMEGRKERKALKFRSMGALR